MSLIKYEADNMSDITLKRTIAIGMFVLTPQRNGVDYGINIFTLMPVKSDPPSKIQALKAAGAFNPRAHQVRHPLFGPSEFFDPRDLPQLKYESLRAIEHDGYSLSRAAQEFGLSRPTIYQAQDQFEQQGLEGLLPRKRGPKQPHKLTPEVRQCLQELAASNPHSKPPELARQLHHRFRVNIHPRTIEKALKAKAKRGRQTST
jgi:transposase